MKIAFIHYHLKTGGVTTVLRQQVRALQGACECLVITGDRAEAKLPCRIVEIPELGYDRPGISPTNAGMIADSVLHALKRQWPGGCDVLHIHNPLLAKNRQFLNIIKRLQQAGVNLFLQVHDFAEDGRPSIYYADDYPADCHYGVINRRAETIMHRAGLEDAGLHYLPNAIAPLPYKAPAGGRKFVLYPVRAIRRKNIGEAILITLFFKSDRHLAITQPPNSPGDIHSYQGWVRWIADRRLPVRVGVGTRVPFSRLLDQAQSMITTSISEGFGFSYLEPWTSGKWLWGRRLDDVCADFEDSGLRLDGLYCRLDIPADWIDMTLYARCFREAVADAAQMFSRTVPTGATDLALSRLLETGRIDFGMLSEPLQRQAAERLIRDADAGKTLVAMNPWLDDPGNGAGRSGTIAANRRIVLARYGSKQYAHRLLAIYDKVMRYRVRHHIDKRALIDAFLDLDRFPLLKWGRDEH